MFDPSVGQWLEEDPLSFEAGDPNTRRYVFNETTCLADLTGLQSDDPPQNVTDSMKNATKKVGVTWTAVDPSKYGGRAITFPDGKEGRLGVWISTASEKADERDGEYKPIIFTAYWGPHARDVHFFQFTKSPVLRYFFQARTKGVEKPKVREDYYRGDANSRNIQGVKFVVPPAGNVYLDSHLGAKEGDYLALPGYGDRTDNSVDMADAPTVVKYLEKWVDSDSVIKTNRFLWFDFRMSFEVFVTYKGKPIRKFEWMVHIASSSFADAVAPDYTYEVSPGTGPLEFTKAHLDQIKARHPEQTIVPIPK